VESYTSITERNILFLSDRSATTVQIIVKTLTGKAVRCNPLLHGDILLLKAEIYGREGIPPGMPQVLSFVSI